MTLTSEPKIYYRKQNALIKEIPLHPDTTRLERLDKTKFKIIHHTKQKKMQHVFRCHDSKECEDWVHVIINQIENLIKSPAYQKSNKMGSQS